MNSFLENKTPPTLDVGNPDQAGEKDENDDGQLFFHLILIQRKNSIF
jgi:hypothetical protein